MPWDDKYRSRFLSAQNGNTLDAKVDVVETKAPSEYGVRVMAVDAECPKEPEIEIVPSKSFDACHCWKLEGRPDNLKGKSVKDLGQWLKTQPGWPKVADIPCGASLFEELEKTKTTTIWVPGVKAAVAWFIAFLIRFRRYQVWPNPCIKIASGDGTEHDFRALGYFGVQAAYNRLRAWWNKHFSQRSYEKPFSMVALFEAH